MFMMHERNKDVHTPGFIVYNVSLNSNVHRLAVVYVVSLFVVVVVSFHPTVLIIMFSSSCDGA